MECVVCKHTFIRLGNYKRHLAKDHPNTTDGNIQSKAGTTPPKQQVNKCGTCDKTFPTPHKLNLHNRIHLNTLAYSCDQCLDTFPTRTRLRLHKEGKHMRSEFECPKCDKKFSSLLSINRHKRTHKEGNNIEVREPPVHECTDCNLKFTHNTELSKHKQTHNNKYYCCLVCDSKFTNKNSLRKHQICHSQDRPHTCETCKQSFARRGDLNVHTRKHTNTRDFKCELCDKTFLRKSHLKSHEKLHSKALTCVKCGVELSGLSEQLMHRNCCPYIAVDTDIDLSPLSESDLIGRLSPVSAYSEDRLTNQSEEFDTEYQQHSLMSHTANEAVTQALKSVVHTPDMHDITPYLSHHHAFPYQYSTGQFDEYYMFSAN